MAQAIAREDCRECQGKKAFSLMFGSSEAFCCGLMVERMAQNGVAVMCGPWPCRWPDTDHLAPRCYRLETAYEA